MTAMIALKEAVHYSTSYRKSLKHLTLIQIPAANLIVTLSKRVRDQKKLIRIKKNLEPEDQKQVK